MSKEQKPVKVRFKNLTEENKDYITLTYYDEELNHKEKIEILTNKFGVTGRTIRKWWLEKMDLQQPSSRLPQQLVIARDRNIDEDTDVIFTSGAQNETSLNRKQLASMEMYKEYITDELQLKTQIALIPIRYRNPTTPTEDQKKTKDMWWVDEVQPYLFYNKIEFGDTTIAADTHVSPTAKMPLNGFEALANGNNLILGAFRIHFKTQARTKNTPLRIMATTGAITRKNYSRSKAGDTASIHHSYGFTIIEKNSDGTCQIPRNIYVTDDGEFTDLCYNVTPEGVTKIDGVEALVWGDIHNEVIDKNIYKKTQKLCKILKPKKHVLHDLLDGARFNPHERKDVYVLRKKIMEGKFLIKEEIDDALKFPKQLLKKCGGEEVFVVQSNHDEFLDRHITDMNWKNDLHNSPAYLHYALIQQTTNLSEHGNLFGYLLNLEYKRNKVKYLKHGDHLTVKGFNLAMHGDFGANGSRGNITQFKRLNFKMVHAHNHSPIIMDGVTSVGLTGKVDQYYARKGISTHANAHCIIHKNGKRQLLVFNDNGEISNLI
tara:strand:+ start:16045 stop:17679 length:1635 start_codon:yes stop_codon:yes gene_type:complete